MIASPVIFGPTGVPIGVIGLSSPRTGEAALPPFKALAHDLGILFSALFHSYGERLRQKRPGAADAQVSQILREEISAHYARKAKAVTELGDGSR